MRAISVHETGEPDVLRLSAAPEPIAGPGELLVHTHATGLNFIETYQRAGVYPLPLPFTPGAEASGTVLAVGAGVTRFAPGDRICTAEGHATYAERFVVRADRVARVPEGVSLETAAALPLQGLTAHYLARSVARRRGGFRAR